MSAGAVEAGVSTDTSVTASADDDQEYAEGVVDIVLGQTITINGEGATVEGSTVEITAAGVYNISGTLQNGRIDIDTEGKVYLEFDGANITSNDGPALCVADAKKVTITLVEGTTSSLADAPGDDESDAALFANDTLIINGGGTLIVTGNNNEGIAGDDDIIINAGTVKITAVDDGLNAHDDITINGGTLSVFAGGDGLDSNGTIHVNGGTLVLFGSTADGDGGVDAVGAFAVTGGSIIAGGGTMAMPCADSTQASIYVETGSIHTAGTTVTVQRDGEEIITFSPGGAFENLLISSSDFYAGVTYQVCVSDTNTVATVVAGIVPAGTGIADTAVEQQ